MRILHLFSMAGVAEMFCKYGAGDKVLQLKQFDPFGFDVFYGFTESFEKLRDLIYRAEQIHNQYDKIIIHDFSEFRLSFPKDKVIFVFHGTKLRQMDEIEKCAVKTYPCFVTTMDLLDFLPNATYLPNPIDLEHFTPKKKGNGWIAINRSYQRESIEKEIKEKYPKTFYYERNSKNIVPYVDMPQFLSEYDHYVDWKFTYDKPIPNSLPYPSCTGLQALAVGCTVHNGNGAILDRSELYLHDARRVSEMFLEQIA